MPDRVIIGSAPTSASLYQLSDGAERMWWRLLTVTDGAGRFEATPSKLRARCFPLWGDRLSDEQVDHRLEEMVRADLVHLYRTGNRLYGVVLNFALHQPTRFRRDRTCFPAPPEEVPLHANGGRPGGRPSMPHAEEDTATRAAEVLHDPVRLARTVRHARVRAVRSTSVQLGAPVITSGQLSARHDCTAPSEKNEGVSVSFCRSGLEPRTPPPKIPSDDLHAFINLLVTVYPRPANLLAVERAVRRLDPDATLRAMITAAIEDQKRWPMLARDNGRYFPALDKWIRSEKWRDQMPQLHRTEPTSTGWKPPEVPEETDEERAARIASSNELKTKIATNGHVPRRPQGDRV